MSLQISKGQVWENKKTGERVKITLPGVTRIYFDRLKNWKRGHCQRDKFLEEYEYIDEYLLLYGMHLL